MILRTLIVALLLSGCSFSQHTVSGEPTLTAGEYEVLAAVIDFFGTENIASHPMIANRTSTFECGSPPHNGMRMGGCNGLQGSGETPQQRMQVVQRDLPQLQPSVVADFMVKNNKTAWIEAKLPTKPKYVMFGLAHADPTPSGWEHPDFFYFSRVGFNAEHTQALVHVSFMSGTNASNSGGKYVFFTKANGGWKRAGSSVVWELVPPQTAQLQ
jgi:hypothetical protein